MSMCSPISRSPVCVSLAAQWWWAYLPISRLQVLLRPISDRLGDPRRFASCLVVILSLSQLLHLLRPVLDRLVVCPPSSLLLWSVQLVILRRPSSVPAIVLDSPLLLVVLGLLLLGLYFLVLWVVVASRLTRRLGGSLHLLLAVEAFVALRYFLRLRAPRPCRFVICLHRSA